jgi:hypothetical protein
MAAIIGNEFGDEQATPADRAFQPGKDAAAGVGIHSDAVAHPRHRCSLAVIPILIDLNLPVIPA